MFGDTQSSSGDIAANAGHLLLLFFAYQIGEPAVWAGGLVLIALISFYGWTYNYKRATAISDIPPSLIASAAQGYVELGGRTSAAPENLIPSPLSGLSCVWFRCWVYEKNNEDDWRVVSESSSPYTIQISDGTGTCQIDADDAEIMGASRRVSYQDNYKHVELLLFGGSNLYVLGEYSTIGGPGSALNLKEDVSDLLASWKQDKTTLLKRFDLDKNGEIDMREWELARREAITEVQQQHREVRSNTGVNVIRAPHDGKLFLISTISPQNLRSRFMFWITFHLFIVFFTLGASILVWQRHHLQALFS